MLLHVCTEIQLPFELSLVFPAHLGVNGFNVLMKVVVRSTRKRVFMSIWNGMSRFYIYSTH
jgi:hypothetical protein